MEEKEKELKEFLTEMSKQVLHYELFYYKEKARKLLNSFYGQEAHSERSEANEKVCKYCEHESKGNSQKV